ncbi:MAG: hypothetical protein COB60_03140 [Flavobacteriaceae bacterium]|nr:MAG: hypothetical protein COB60_03140 [Flavobacteriaceae bacterium]
MYYTGTEPGKPIRVSDVPEVTSVNLLRTGELVDYSYKDGVLIIPNPDAGPDRQHEIIEVKF